MNKREEKIILRKLALKISNKTKEKFLLTKSLTQSTQPFESFLPLNRP